MFTALTLAFASDLAVSVPARVIVGGALNYASKDIVDDDVNFNGHTALVTAWDDRIRAGG